MVFVCVPIVRIIGDSNARVSGARVVDTIPIYWSILQLLENETSLITYFSDVINLRE